MKIKLLLTTVFLLVSVHCMAQDDKDIIDREENRSEIITIDEIFNDQLKVDKNKKDRDDLEDVWKRRTFFNISYSSTTLESIGEVKTECKPQEFASKSDWGISLLWGRNIRLHNKPISNIVDISLDYTWFDLSINHYNVEPNYVYDSSQTYSNGNYCSAWGLEKYEFTYAMTLGPSVTVAPFVSHNSKNLHPLRFQFYYHIGYSISAINMVNDESRDASTMVSITDKRISWGHGLAHNIGLTLIWKSFGIGYERRFGNIEYLPTNTKFGKDKSKFSDSFNRFYIQFRI